MFFEVIKIVFPVFAVAGVGYIYAAFRKIDLSTITSLILYLLAPCLIIDSLSRHPLSTGDLGLVFVSCLLLMAGAGGLMWVIFRALKIDRWGLLLPTMFMNGANLPMSLCAIAFGPSALSASVAAFVAVSLVHYSVGTRIIAGGSESGWGEVARMPLMHAAVIGLAFNVTHYSLPAPLARAFQLLGDACIPLMLFSLGYQLQAIRPRLTAPSAISVAIRMLFGPALGVAVWKLLGLEGDVARAILLVSVMPGAVMNFVLAQRYNRDVEHVSAAVFYGSIVAIFTIPAMLYFIKQAVP